MNPRMQLLRRDDNEILIPRLEVAATFWSRLTGWQFRRRPADEFGLLLAPCNSIHTCFLRFPLDIAFLDELGTVLELRKQLRPWTLAGPVRGACFVVEMSGGTMPLRLGQQHFVACDGPLKPALRRRLGRLLVESKPS